MVSSLYSALALFTSEKNKVSGTSAERSCGVSTPGII